MTKVTPLAALDSSYIWVIQPQPSVPQVYVVDPGEAQPVVNYLERHQLALQGILVTHRHRDHTGGIEELRRQWPVPVYGPESPDIPQVTHPLQEGDRLSLSGLDVEILEIPGHTREHIAFYLSGSLGDTHKDPPLLFCGDTLFAGGCGRVFDGSAASLWQSLSRLASLPEHTRVYCAHEYTLANLLFAPSIEPNNPALHQRLIQTQQQRAVNASTLPSTLAEEKRTNPFLRCQDTVVKSSIEALTGQIYASELEVFTALRRLKDQWQG